MDLRFLPKDIEDIIIDYINQLEITEKYDKVIEELKSVQKHFKTNDFTHTGIYYIFLNQQKFYSYSFCNCCGEFKEPYINNFCMCNKGEWIYKNFHKNRYYTPNPKYPYVGYKMEVENLERLERLYKN